MSKAADGNLQTAIPENASTPSSASGRAKSNPNKGRQATLQLAKPLPNAEGVPVQAKPASDR
jgi:hypothetical protein